MDDNCAFSPGQVLGIIITLVLLLAILLLSLQSNSLNSELECIRRGGEWKERLNQYSKTPDVSDYVCVKK